MHRFRFSSIAPVVLLFSACIVSLQAGERDPWAGPPFSVIPAEVIAASGDVPVDDDHGVQVLLEEGHFLFDEEGRVEYRFRMIYRVDSPGAVSGWSRVSHAWHPWYQERPLIEARVITPEGNEYRLDPSDLGEFSDAADGPDLYSDEKVLRGPLPAVKVGSIIEEFHVVRDHQPHFEAGVIRSFGFVRPVPIQRTRLLVDAPSSLPLQYQVHRLPDIEIQRETDGGRVRLRFENGLQNAWEDDADLAPGEIARQPVVRFSTGSSWNAIASRYSDIVDEKIAASDVERIVKKAVGKETARDRIVASLLAELHDRVRYTGVEFGERSIIPEEPEKTLSRRFGDCKDKSTLLTAMLRQAGFEARVALLNTGPGSDVDPELPGMGRFDHAIVYVSGDPGIWIDPTDPAARAGELPNLDQGRLALIAAPSTIGLALTPKSSPSDNVRREQRDVVFEPDGRGHVIETTTVTGAFERRFRSSFSRKNESGLREQIETYAKSHYNAEELGELEVSDPEDLTQPMRLRLEARQCGDVKTTASEASVSLKIGTLVRDLPTILKPDKKGDDEEKEPRKHPVVLDEPYVAEIRYVAKPPPGYEPSLIPDSGRRSFGPAVMTHDYTVAEDGTVTADLRFDSVKEVYTAEEAIAIKEAITEFYKEDMPRLIFQQVGEAHLEAGRIREAMLEFQHLVDLFPEQALYRTQVARAYLAAGLGGKARIEARRAVRLASDSLVAQRTLGIILSHDELGRKFVPGFDHEGAERALRQAKEIDPEDFMARGELAILLEHNDDGERYGPDSRLDEAIAEYQALRTDLESEGLTTNLLAAMLRAGKFEDLLALRDEVPKTNRHEALFLAATAVVEGANEAIQAASRAAGQASVYQGILKTASDWLSQARRYPEASELLAAAARGADDSVNRLAAADMLRRIKVYESYDISPSTPEGAVRAFFVALVGKAESGAPTVQQLFHREVLDAIDDETLTEQIDAVRNGLLWALRRSGISGDRTLDWLLSISTLTSQGDDATGYRVRMGFPWAGEGGGGSLSVYLVRRGEDYRAMGVSSAWSTIGSMLLRWVEEERLEPARRWLDWIIEEISGTGGSDELDSMPVRWLWSAESKRDADDIRLAAASLMSDGTYGDRPIAILRNAAESRADDDSAVGVDLALAIAARSVEDHELQLEAAARLVAAYPRSPAAFLLRVGPLIELERFDEVEREVAARRKRLPGDPLASSIYADIPRMTGNLAEHRRRLVALTTSGKATAGEYNNLAWLDIVEENVSDESLRLAQQAVAMTEYSQTSSLHTLATVYAELRRVTEARDVLLALLENRPSSDLASPDWYILGRIAEEYGVVDAALEAYERVESPEGGPDASSTFAIAAKRIAALGKDE